jgi:hypothetical protein
LIRQLFLMKLLKQFSIRSALIVEDLTKTLTPWCAST